MVGDFREAADPGLGRQVPLRPEADRNRHQRSSSGKILFSVRDCQGRWKSAAVRIGKGANVLYKLRHAYIFNPSPRSPPPSPLTPSPVPFSFESFLCYFLFV
jgi:hypothetical protein